MAREIPIVTVQSARDHYAALPPDDTYAQCNSNGWCALARIWRPTFPMATIHVAPMPFDSSYDGYVRISYGPSQESERKLTPTENVIASRFDDLDSTDHRGNIQYRRPMNAEIVAMLDQMLEEGYE